MAMSDEVISAVQANIACAALKEHQPDLYQGDPIFGSSELWRFHTPIFQGVLKMALVPADYVDPILPFRVLSALVSLLLLGGMYGLLYRQTKSWSVSAFVAVLSITVVHVLGGTNWGVGSLASITPQTIFLAMSPLIVMAYLNYESHWRLLLVFLFIGLMGNLHLVTAMNLTLVLLVVYLGRKRFAPRAWGMAVICGLCSLAAASPYIAYYFGIKAHIPQGQGSLSALAVEQAFRITQQEVLYPELLKGMLEVGLLLRLTLLGVVAVAVLSRWERFRLRYKGFWIWMIAAVLLVGLGLQALSQLVGAMAGTGPPVIDFLRASSLLLLPLYALLAQGLVNVFRLVRRSRRLLRWCCLGLLVVWMLPSENLSPARRWVYTKIGHFTGENEQPRQLRRLEEDRFRRAELGAIADWARRGGHSVTLDGKPCNPEASAMFVTDKAEFRLMSRRPILAAREDVRFIFYLAPLSIEKWVSRFSQQQHILHGNADNLSLRNFFADLIYRPEMQQIKQWYVIIDASVPTDQYGALEQVHGADWGRQYRLYRLNTAKVTNVIMPIPSAS